MFRYLIRSFQKSLIITRHDLNTSGGKLFIASFSTDVPSVEPVKKPDNPLETAEYIVTYSGDRESRRRKNKLVVDALRKRLTFTNDEIDQVLAQEVVQQGKKLIYHNSAIDTLCKYGIKKNTFLEYPWLLTIDSNRLELKLLLLFSLKIRDINDFAPFLQLSYERLERLVRFLRRERHHIPQGNRLHYIHEKLQLPISTVSKYLYNRLFILEMPFYMLQENLENMLKYQVASLDILRDLWAFRYKPRSVLSRLERAKIAKKEKIMPWMVRCPEGILQKSFKLSIEEDKILGDKCSLVDYIAERLGFSATETRAILNKHPNVFRVRVPKVKEVLDYLLDEEHFTRHEVARVPRILCHSLKTTKARINELKSFDCRPSSLVILCKSKKEYEKFVNSWKDFKTKLELRSKKTNN